MKKLRERLVSVLIFINVRAQVAARNKCFFSLESWDKHNEEKFNLFNLWSSSWERSGFIRAIKLPYTTLTHLTIFLTHFFASLPCSTSSLSYLLPHLFSHLLPSLLTSLLSSLLTSLHIPHFLTHFTSSLTQLHTNFLRHLLPIFTHVVSCTSITFRSHFSITYNLLIFYFILFSAHGSIRVSSFFNIYS